MGSPEVPLWWPPECTTACSMNRAGVTLGFTSIMLCCFEGTPTSGSLVLNGAQGSCQKLCQERFPLLPSEVPTKLHLQWLPLLNRCPQEEERRGCCRGTSWWIEGPQRPVNREDCPPISGDWVEKGSLPFPSSDFSYGFLLFFFFLLFGLVWGGINHGYLRWPCQRKESCFSQS